MRKPTAAVKEDMIQVKLRNDLALLFLVSVTFTCSYAQQRDFELPESAKKQLQQQFGYWKHGDIIIRIFSDQTGKEIRREFADLIQGDFNGDGDRDYAGIFVLDDSTEWKDFLIVLLADTLGFKAQILDKVSLDATPIVYPIPRGTVQEDLEIRNKVEYRYDAIGSGIFEKSYSTWYYQDGQFLVIGTGD